MKQILVIGAGISGLSTAYQLRKLGGDSVDVQVLEASARPGGNIRTDRIDGCLIEEGPNGFLDNVEATPRLIRELGLLPRLQKADAGAERRYLYRRGRLYLLPASALGFFTSPLLSIRGRLRVGMEAFARKRPSGIDESVYEFAARRIGKEAAQVLVDAMVSGVFAGDVEKLSLRSTFPKMAEMEDQYGGLVRAMLARALAKRKEGKRGGRKTAAGGPTGPGGRLSSFEGGLDLFPRTLADSLGPALHLDSPVLKISRNNKGWEVRCSEERVYSSDALLLSTPASVSAALLEPISPKTAEMMRSIPTAPLVVVALAFEKDSVKDLPTGFGFLAPRGEGLRILGCLWDSEVFPGRAPAGIRLMRAMIGGAHDHEAIQLPDEKLLEIVLRELGSSMGLQAKPTLAEIYRYPLGIAQYERGHLSLVNSIRLELKNFPGLWVSGSSYDGISMNSCIEKAEATAMRMLERR